MLASFLGIGSGVLAISLAGFMLVARPRQLVTRLLALELLNVAVVESGGIVALLVGPPLAGPVINVTRFAIGTVPFVHLLLLSTLATPLVARLGGSLARRGLALGGLAMGLVLAVAPPLPDYARADGIAVDNWATSLLIAQYFLISLVAVFGLFAAADAFRRSERGSGAREKARAFLVAFGLRDAIAGAGLALMVAGCITGEHVSGTQQSPLVTLGIDLTRLATLIAAPLMVHGILRCRLFDIDVRLRLGFQAGAVAALMVVGAFASIKLTEYYLTGNVGYSAGALATGLLLFLTPRLNAMAERVAKRQAPATAPTTEYTAFRKLEVYRAALESAFETGGIDQRQRMVLDRLRVKLALQPADAAAIEADLEAELFAVAAHQAAQLPTFAEVQPVHAGSFGRN